MPDIQEQLRTAQARVKALAGKRDQLNREVGVEEQKLKQVHDNLRALNVTNPESLSVEALKKLAEDTQSELEVNLSNLMTSLENGESLLRDYEQFQQAQ